MPSRAATSLWRFRVAEVGIIRAAVPSSLLSDIDPMRRGDDDGQASAGPGDGTAGAVRAGFRRELERQGYTPNSASTSCSLMAHASRWLEAQGLGVEGSDAGPGGGVPRSPPRRGLHAVAVAKAMVPTARLPAGAGRGPTPSVGCPAPDAVSGCKTTIAPTWFKSAAWRRAPSPAICTWRGCSSRAAGRWRAAPGSAERGRGDRVRAGRVRVALGRLGQVRRVRAAVAAALPLRRRPHRRPLDAAVPSVAGWRLAGVPVLRPRRGGPPAGELRPAHAPSAGGTTRC